MHYKTFALIGLIAALAVATGCTTVSRGVGKMTFNKYAEPRSGTVWVIPPPDLAPPRDARRNIYVSYRNISDASEIDLTGPLRQAIADRGWTLIEDPGAADYRLRATLRYFGEVEPSSGGARIAQSMGGVTGAAVGAGVGLAAYEATDSVAGGAATGVIAGGLVGAGMQNASRPREWALIIDFVLDERADEPIEVKLYREVLTGAAGSAGTESGRMHVGGSSNASNTKTISATRTTNYYPHGVRLAAWANQMNMRKDEAVPHLLQRVDVVVDHMLPM